MTTQSLARRTETALAAAPVGVLADTLNTAQSLARELRIPKPVLLSPKSIQGASQGCNLGVLLVDDSAWPLPNGLGRLLLPRLARHLGYILHVTRIDPKRKR